jgi:lipoprotein signal peptidase
MASIRSDHFTKSLAVKYLTGEQPIEIVPNILALTLHYNSGIAFGIAVPLRALLVITSLVIL